MLESILITAALIIGIHSITRDGFLLGFVERFWKKKPGPFNEKESRLRVGISSPISECPLCMSSLWGSLGYLYLVRPEYGIGMIGGWLLFVLAVAGIVEIVTSIAWK